MKPLATAPAPLLSFVEVPATPIAQSDRSEAPAESVAASDAPFGVVTTLLAGAAGPLLASAFYILYVHPASAQFEEQWRLGFALALFAWLQAFTAAVLSVCFRAPAEKSG